MQARSNIDWRDTCLAKEGWCDIRRLGLRFIHHNIAVSMLRLVIALALGTSTQAFVAAPQHRLSLSSCARGHNSSPGEGDDDACGLGVLRWSFTSSFIMLCTPYQSVSMGSARGYQHNIFIYIACTAVLNTTGSSAAVCTMYSSSSSVVRLAVLYVPVINKGPYVWVTSKGGQIDGTILLL